MNGHGSTNEVLAPRSVRVSFPPSPGLFLLLSARFFSFFPPPLPPLFLSRVARARGFFLLRSKFAAARA